MKKAFRSYPIELAACTDLRDMQKESEFFADCKRHFENIHQTVTETFHAPGYDLDKTDAVLEPSYICEALGLQGRLDYMQRDMSSFIEMKSGKADEYAIRGKVEPKENNRVQMLLYQAVLQYSMGKDHHEVKPYLLYTRYPLLYPARSSWSMVRRAIDVRNRIVATEYGIQLRNSPQYTAQKLEEICPETLNERSLDNALWQRYLAPGIAAVHDSIKQLSPIEAHYFYSLYNFITKELYTSKSGDTAYEGHTGAASLWLSSLAEKVEAGEILYGLRIRDNHAADIHKPYLVLSCPPAPEDEGIPLPNFREGDAVVLYERNVETDNVTNKMVFKGNIEQASPHELRMRLRATQQNTHVLPADSCYAVEHDYMDTSYRSMLQGLSAFLRATQRRRDLLLGQRPPEFDTSLDADIAACADKDFERITLKARAAKDYFLLIGPPGTGEDIACPAQHGGRLPPRTEANPAVVLHQPCRGRNKQDAGRHYARSRLHPPGQRVGLRRAIPPASDRKRAGRMPEPPCRTGTHSPLPHLRGHRGYRLIQTGVVPAEDLRRGHCGRSDADTRTAVAGTALPAQRSGRGCHRQIHPDWRP